MKRVHLTLIAAIVALAAGLGLSLMLNRDSGTRPDSGMRITVLSAPRALPAVRLVNQANEAFTPDSLKGHWSVMFFGFSHCPDICPTTLYDLARFRKSIADLPAAELPGIFLVSVDPERDTPEQLSAYVRAFDASFTGVTGEPAEIARLAAALGVAYGREPAEGDEYTVLHTAALFILDPEARYVAVSSAPHDMGQLARDYRTLISKIGN